MKQENKKPYSIDFLDSQIYVLMLMRRHIAFIHGKPYLELSLPIKYFCCYYLKKKAIHFSHKSCLCFARQNQKVVI